LSGFAAFGVLMPYISNGGAEMADRYGLVLLSQLKLFL
jgi:hypothetical protein